MTALLKSMIQDLINDRPEQAEVAIHNYIVAKTQEVAGLTEGKGPSATSIEDAVAAALKAKGYSGKDYGVDHSDGDTVTFTVYRRDDEEYGYDEDDPKADQKKEDQEFEIQDAIEAGLKKAKVKPGDIEEDSEDGEKVYIVTYGR